MELIAAPVTCLLITAINLSVANLGSFFFITIWGIIEHVIMDCTSIITCSIIPQILKIQYILTMGVGCILLDQKKKYFLLRNCQAVCYFLLYLTMLYSGLICKMSNELNFQNNGFKDIYTALNQPKHHIIAHQHKGWYHEVLFSYIKGFSNGVSFVSIYDFLYFHVMCRLVKKDMLTINQRNY